MVTSADIAGMTGHARRSTTGQPMIVPGMPGTSGPRTIVSVFPMEQSLKLRHEGFKNYILPSAPKGSHVQLTVHDSYAWNRNFNADRFELYPAPIPATSIADNLIQRFTTGMIGTKDGLGPGIMICADVEPTEEEIATVVARQEAYFRYLINEADFLFAKNQVGDIHDVHRMAADWMGTHDRAWAKPLVHVEMKRCPACDEEVRGSAKFCRWCHTDIPAWIAKEEKALKALTPKA
jgi:hypothetical protein